MRRGLVLALLALLLARPERAVGFRCVKRMYLFDVVSPAGLKLKVEALPKRSSYWVTTETLEDGVRFRVLIDPYRTVPGSGVDCSWRPIGIRVFGWLDSTTVLEGILRDPEDFEQVGKETVFRSKVRLTLKNAPPETERQR